MAICLNHSKATGTAKVVLLGIANHDGDGGAWPTVATLSRYANVTVRNVQKAISDLVALGEVVVHYNEGGNRGARHERPNRYDITLSCPPECDRTKNHRVSNATGGVGNDTTLLSETTPPPVSKSTPKPSLEPSKNAAATTAQIANRVTKAYTDRVPLSRFPAVAAIVRKALAADYSAEAVESALVRLADQGRPVTVDTLRIELTKAPAQKPAATFHPYCLKCDTLLPKDRRDTGYHEECA